MVFGLAGLLITLGVIILILNYAVLPYTKEVSTVNKKVRPQVEQIAGEKDGMRTTESIKMEPQTSNGKTNSLLVTSIVVGGPMESYFGLKRNDSIVEVNGMKVRDWNDGEMAVAQALEAYQRKGTLTVVRDGETITLPQAQQATAAAPAGSGQQQPAGQSQPQGGLQSQLDAIQKIGTH
jgi:hypothetical protein